jgi:hypothetical protein
MPVCNKCFIDKPQDEYFRERKGDKYYYKKYCLDCFRKQSRDWKARNRASQKIKTDPNIKQCTDCKEYKNLEGFYLNTNGNHIKRCKACHGLLYKGWKEEKLANNGGSNSYYQQPNRYWDKEQKDQVFMVMNALGWIYDQPTGIWNKPNVKENGIFINMVLNNKPKRINTGNGGRKIKTGVYNNIDKIVKLIDEGHSYIDVADTFECSHTTIRKIVSDYRNEKRAS